MSSPLKQVVKNPKVQVAVQFVVSLVVLTLLFKSINLIDLKLFITSINIWFLVLSLCLTFLIRFLWAYQIYITQAPLNMHFSVYDLFRIQMIATFYSLVLPGDIIAGGVSWFKLSRPDRKLMEAGALLILFRLIQIASLIGVGLIAAFGDPQLGSPTFLTFAIILSLGLFIILLPFFSNRVTKLLNHFFIQIHWK